MRYLITISYDGTNDNIILNLLAESEYVIASRFHAVVLAMVAGRPVLPIIYSDKTLHILEDLNFNGSMFDIRKQEEWNYEESRKNLEIPVQVLTNEISEMAQQHFEKLDIIFKKK